MKSGKVPDHDCFNIELIKAVRHELWKTLAISSVGAYLYTINSNWKELKTILLYKKGEEEGLK